MGLFTVNEYVFYNLFVTIWALWLWKKHVSSTSLKSLIDWYIQGCTCSKLRNPPISKLSTRNWRAPKHSKTISSCGDNFLLYYILSKAVRRAGLFVSDSGLKLTKFWTWDVLFVVRAWKYNQINLITFAKFFRPILTFVFFLGLIWALS